MWQGGWVPSTEELRGRAAAVVEVALDRLLEHGRRGNLEPLWDAALDETDRRLRSLKSSTGAPARLHRSYKHAGLRSKLLCDRLSHRAKNAPLWPSTRRAWRNYTVNLCTCIDELQDQGIALKKQT